MKFKIIGALLILATIVLAGEPDSNIIYHYLRLQGCNGGCSEEYIKDLKKLPRVVIDSNFVVHSLEYNMIYKVNVKLEDSLIFEVIDKSLDLGGSK